MYKKTNRQQNPVNLFFYNQSASHKFSCENL